MRQERCGSGDRGGRCEVSVPAALLGQRCRVAEREHRYTSGGSRGLGGATAWPEVDVERRQRRGPADDEAAQLQGARAILHDFELLCGRGPPGLRGRAGAPAVCRLAGPPAQARAGPFLEGCASSIVFLCSPWHLRAPSVYSFKFLLRKRVLSGIAAGLREAVPGPGPCCLLLFADRRRVDKSRHSDRWICGLGGRCKLVLVFLQFLVGASRCALGALHAGRRRRSPLPRPGLKACAGVAGLSACAVRPLLDGHPALRRLGPPQRRAAGAPAAHARERGGRRAPGRRVFRAVRRERVFKAFLRAFAEVSHGQGDG
mmetsp:Transcript_60686/g.198651  ORF Transcript_60686/g.198651 Transcript_60686/m.198651 type:complete len:315 (+) Transcript_60686:2162-3106(+)